MGEFNGWRMPISYSSILEESRWCRQEAALFDTCHMDQLLYRGSFERMEPFFTRKLRSAPPGKARYVLMLSNSGGILQDLLVYRLDSDALLFVLNAGSGAGVKRILGDAAPGISYPSERNAKIDLQGPRSFRVLEELFSLKFSLKPFSFTEIRLGGIPCLLSRTGYTGEPGVEIYLPPGKVPELWNKILSHPGVRTAGLGARDLLRLEAGLVLYGSDIDERVNPFEAGLERFLDFEKDFRGKEALEDIKDKGTESVRMGLVSETRRAPRAGSGIFSGEKKVGRVTSGGFSPSLQRGIAMGYIRREYSEPGTGVTVKRSGRDCAARVSDLPLI